MKTILVAITVALFSTAALSDPRMDANASPSGYSGADNTDEIHLNEHGC